MLKIFFRKRLVAYVIVISMFFVFNVTNATEHFENPVNGNILCSLNALGGDTWNQKLAILNVDHLFYRTRETGSTPAYGYGYGFSISTNWKYGYGYGYGYDIFCNSINSMSGSRAGFFYFEVPAAAATTATMNLSSVVSNNIITVPDNIELTLSGTGAGSKLALPTGLTMTSTGLDGNVDITYTTVVPAGVAMTSGEVVSVNVNGASASVQLDMAAIVTVPYAGFGSLANPAVKILDVINTVYTVSECSNSQYISPGTLDNPASYSLAAYATGGAQNCYKYDNSNVYIATNHFSSFVVGEASTSATTAGVSSGANRPISKLKKITEKKLKKITEKKVVEKEEIDKEKKKTDEKKKVVEEKAPAVAKKITNFTDLVTLIPSKPEYPVVKQMLELGLMKGSTDTQGNNVWRMHDNMNRAEAAVFIARYFGYNDKIKITGAPFEDVPADEWYASSVAYLKSLGIIRGRTPMIFAPANDISRAELLKMAIDVHTKLHPEVATDWKNIMKTGSKTFGDIKKTDWYYPYMNLADTNKLLNGYIKNKKKYMKPNNGILRIESAAMLSKLIGL